MNLENSKPISNVSKRLNIRRNRSFFISIKQFPPNVLNWSLVKEPEKAKVKITTSKKKNRQLFNSAVPSEQFEFTLPLTLNKSPRTYNYYFKNYKFIIIKQTCNMILIKDFTINKTKQILIFRFPVINNLIIIGYLF